MIAVASYNSKFPFNPRVMLITASYIPRILGLYDRPGFEV